MSDPLNNDEDAIALAIELGAYDCVQVVNGKQKLRTWTGSDSPEARAATRKAIVDSAKNYARSPRT